MESKIKSFKLILDIANLKKSKCLIQRMFYHLDFSVMFDNCLLITLRLSLKMASTRHVKLKSSWKKFDISPELLSDKEFESLISCKVLTDYEILDSNATKSRKSSQTVRNLITLLKGGNSNVDI